MLERGKNERGVIEMVDTESLVPAKHLLPQVDGAVHFEKLYEIVEPLYSEGEGRHSIDPMVLFKIVLLQHLDGNASLRGGTLRRAQTRDQRGPGSPHHLRPEWLCAGNSGYPWQCS